MRTPSPPPTTRYAVGSLLALVLLSACGSVGGDGGDGGSSVSPSSMPSPSPSDSADPGGTTPSMPPSGRARPTTMGGRVTSTGACTVFENDRDATRWVLIGEVDGLRAGTAYRVEGVAMDAVNPDCPQGLPFLVSRAIEGDYVEDLPVLPTPPSTGQTMTLTGVATDGVEAGCRVFQSDQGTFVLVGSVTVPDGQRVTVRGVRRDDLMTTCQQGPAFEVQTVIPVR
ncbi:hypothetical protein LL946_08900 [Knoellia locipacati]|uniref:hypothetical protein n=1 Tax=Knoellia locipacati TaxID=882824 RepID=UPI003850AE5B